MFIIGKKKGRFILSVKMQKGFLLFFMMAMYNEKIFNNTTYDIYMNKYEFYMCFYTSANMKMHKIILNC